jgi:hypothetical protein
MMRVKTLVVLWMSFPIRRTTKKRRMRLRMKSPRFASQRSSSRISDSRLYRKRKLHPRKPLHPRRPPHPRKLHPRRRLRNQRLLSLMRMTTKFAFLLKSGLNNVLLISVAFPSDTYLLPIINVIIIMRRESSTCHYRATFPFLGFLYFLCLDEAPPQSSESRPSPRPLLDLSTFLSIMVSPFCIYVVLRYRWNARKGERKLSRTVSVLDRPHDFGCTSPTHSPKQSSLGCTIATESYLIHFPDQEKTQWWP